MGPCAQNPQAGWTGTDLAGAIKAGLGVPVVFDTDVNGAALAEGRWGAAQGLSDYAYITVGTGIGGGIVSGGALVHGVMHGELGHIPVPHDLTSDPYEGHCPFHGDCLKDWPVGRRLKPAGERLHRLYPPIIPPGRWRRVICRCSPPI
ncbi:hypothetical protein JCM17846_03760 [Iodidimonas nitroreducens]|uniref:Fructokinase n=1 Tax=Iodidimonas nitroreducens TaxID=1236968 RepID=A0A5A7N4L4_9PROT|nr:hypothetical protein JCM17846_03760 [Iodidimonas nitroreducens]